jgi:PPE-repeat protein
MHFAALPPEVNSGRMYAGPGAGPMLSAATAWDELANELHSTAANLESVISTLAAQPWQGPSSASMAAAAAPQVAWLSSTAAQATQTSAQAKAAASAYESAFAMTVHPGEVTANRAELSSLVATNLLGQNTPAIAATEVEYGEMWAQDVAAMYSYAGESEAASQVTPFTPPRQNTNQGGVAAQGAAAGRAAGTAAGHAQTALSGGNTMSAVPKALQSLSTSTAESSLFSDFSNPYDLVSLGSSLLGNGTGLIGVSGAASFITNAEQKLTGINPGSSPAPSAPEHSAAKPTAPRPTQKVSAQMGRSASLSGLKVPQGWTTSAPELRLTALESPAAGSVPAARPGAGLFGGQMPLLGGAPLMALSGRDKSDSRRPGGEGDAKGRAAAAPQPRVEMPSGAPAGPPSGNTAELREMTEVLSKLAQLRDSGALSEHEFIDQKQRLLGGQ